MKTLFFTQPRPPFLGNKDYLGQGGNNTFDIESVAPIDEASYWIVGSIFIACIIYMALGVFIAYRISYQSPKKQTKWLKNKYPENSDES